MSPDLLSQLPPPRPIDRRVRVLNVQLLLVSCAIVLVLGIALRKWHVEQVARHADTLRMTAQEAARAAQWQDVESRLRRYLRLRPDDLDALELFAKAKSQTALSRTDLAKAIQTYLDLVRLDPARQTCWLPIAELQLRAGEPGDALGSISHFLISKPRDPYALAVRAATLEQLHLLGGSLPLSMVIEAYDDAVQANPGDVSLACQLATLIERDDDPSGSRRRGLEIMDQLVERFPNRAAAYFARYLFRRQFYPPTHGAEIPDLDLAKAIELEPENSEMQLALLRDRLERFIQSKLSTRGARESASSLESDLQRRIQVSPEDARGYYMLASLQEEMRQLRDAVATLKEARQLTEAPAALIDARLATLLMSTGDWKQASQVIARLAQLAPEEPARALASPNAVDDPEISIGTAGLLAHSWQARPAILADQLWVQWYRAEENPQMDLDHAAGHLQRLVDQSFPLTRLGELWTQLGDCYFTLRDWDLATEAYQRAAANDPTSPAAWVGLAESYRQRGQIDLALDRYRHLLRTIEEPSIVGPVRVAVAELQLLRLQSMPARQRRWLDFDEAFRDASVAMPKAPALLFLDLQATLAKDPQLANDPATIRAWSEPLIREQEEFLGTDPLFWQSAFAWHWHFGNRPAAMHSLVRLEAMTGATAFPQRLEVAFTEGGFAAAQSVIAAARESMSPCRFSIFLTAVARDLQDHPRSMAWIEGMLLLDPDNLRLRGILAELAAYAGDVTQLQKCSNELLRLEGSDGAHFRWAKLQLLLVDARLGIPERIFWARAEARTLFAQRPQWNLAMAALGNVAEMEGRLDEAISHYGDAFRADHRDVRILARYVALLTLNERQREAREVLRSLPDSKCATPELLPMAARLEILAGAPEEAVKLAEVAVAQDPTRGQAWRVLGEAQLAMGQPDFEQAALRSFERATAVQPRDHAAWISLLWFHIHGQHPDRSLQILDTLQGFAALFRSGPDALGPADQDYLLARCVEIDGDWRRANTIYRRSIRRRATQFRHPLPPGTVYSLELAGPEELDSRALVQSLSPVTRQTFGLLLATETDQVAAEAAMTFLDDDIRLSSLAAMVRGGPDHLRLALAQMEKLPPDTTVRGDVLLIARLQTLLGDRREAAVTMRQLRTLQPMDAQCIEWAKVALMEDRPEDVTAALSALKEPDRWRFEAAKLKVQILHAQREHTNAIAAATAEGLSVEESAELLALLDERRRALELLLASQSSTRDRLTCAAFLSRDPESFELAVSRLEGVARIEPLQAALAATRILARPLGAAEGRLRLDQLIRNVLAENPENVGLLNALSLTRESEGSLNEALRLTREVLKIDPQNVAAQNNFCWLMASYQADAEGALGMMKEALYRCGPEPALLDTLAMAELSLGHTNEAIRLLEQCCFQDSALAAPANWLHLAEAYQVGGHQAEATRLVQILRRDQFRPTNPRDQSAFARLERSLYTEAE